MPDPDPRDEIVYGVRALRGIADLVAEISHHKAQFEILGTEEFSELLGMVEARLSRAAGDVQQYVPREPRA